MHDRDEQQIDRYQIDKTERKKGGQVEEGHMKGWTDRSLIDNKNRHTEERMNGMRFIRQ